MKPCFADSFYYLALLSPDDAAHRQAREVTMSLSRPIVTTAWILTEVGDALRMEGRRKAFLGLMDALRSDPDASVVPPSEDLFVRGVGLYADRLDKQWSLTDCISFVVMRERQIEDALTGDHHFEQAGFVALLK